MTPHEAEARFHELFESLEPYFARLVKSFLLVAIAIWLAWAQRHTSYSLIAVGSLVLIFSLFNRYAWVTGALLLWFLALYFVTPEMMAGLKAMRG